MFKLFQTYGWDSESGKVLEVFYTPQPSLRNWLFRTKPQQKRFKRAAVGYGWVESGTYRPATTSEIRNCNRVLARAHKDGYRA